VRFPRSLRLLRHADFERVYKTGRRHFSASLTAFYAPQQDWSLKKGSPKEDGSPEKDGSAKEGSAKEALPRKSYASAKRPLARGLRVGFTVGRALGGAVQRNRMKRRLREAVRLSSPPVEVHVDVVINPKKSLLATDFEAVLNEVRRAFVVIEKNSCQLPVPSSQKRTEAGGNTREV
jgi:ribonuclease P protein component